MKEPNVRYQNQGDYQLPCVTTKDPNSYTIVFGSTEGEENIYQVIGKEGGTIGWYAVNIKTGAVREYSMVDVG